MTEPLIELEHGLDADGAFSHVPDVLFDYLYARANGIPTFYDDDFDVLIRSFTYH